MRRRELLGALGSIGAIATAAGCTTGGRPGGRDDGDSIDAQGDIAVVVDGEPVDLDADRYQAEHAENDSIDFHLHEGDDHWYMEGEERLTLGEALDRLPHFAYERADDRDVLTVDGEAYDESEPGTEMSFSVDGEPVDPSSYELRDGDAIRVEIEAGA